MAVPYRKLMLLCSVPAVHTVLLSEQQACVPSAAKCRCCSLLWETLRSTLDLRHETVHSDCHSWQSCSCLSCPALLQYNSSQLHHQGTLGIC